MSNEKALALRKLLEQRPFTALPGVYDCLSAKLAERAGASALFLSGAALSVAGIGKPDVGFLGFSNFAEAARRILSVTGLPLLCDADNGFGNAVHAAAAAAELDQLGLAGMQLDDQVLPQTAPTSGKEALPWHLVAPKLRAARQSAGPPFVLLFRTIANLTDSTGEAIRRVNLAAACGADIAYVDGLCSMEEIREVAARAKLPLLINLNEKGFAASVPVEEIKSLGYRAGLYPVSAVAAAAKCMEEVFSELIAHESTARFHDRMLHPVELYNLFGLDARTKACAPLYRKE